MWASGCVWRTHTHTHKCTGSRQQQKNYDCVIKEEMCSRMLRSTHENQSQSSHVSISFNVVVFFWGMPRSPSTCTSTITITVNTNFYQKPIIHSSVTEKMKWWSSNSIRAFFGSHSCSRSQCQQFIWTCVTRYLYRQKWKTRSLQITPAKKTIPNEIEIDSNGPVSLISIFNFFANGFSLHSMCLGRFFRRLLFT